MGDAKSRKQSRNIGIMTWWHNANYGGFLQGLALQTWLERQGYDAELIDFTYPRFEVRWWNVFGLVRWTNLRHLVTRPLLILRRILVDGCQGQRVRRVVKTHAMLERFAMKSIKRYRSMKDVGESGRYDTVLVGSDQVWNPKSYGDKVSAYLLEGLDDDCRRVSYASSVSNGSVAPYEELYARALAKFHTITIREKTNIPELERLSGKSVKWVVDPTLLLTDNEWRTMMLPKGEREKGNHILVYWLSGINSGLVKEWIEYARLKKTKVYVMTNLDGFMPKEGYNLKSWFEHLVVRLRIAASPWIKIRIDADASGFLECLSTAEEVVSDSFHALMFSTIFKKRIRVFVPASRKFMSSRIVDFLEKITENQLVNDCRDDGCEVFDFDASKLDESRLQKWINESKRILADSLA